MEECLRLTEHHLALCNESIRQSNRLIDVSVVWLSAFRASRPLEHRRANHARIAKSSGLKRAHIYTDKKDL